MTKAVWFHCFAGIAGDMTLGSLIDAGADVADVAAELEKLDVAGWRLEAKTVQRAGVRATHVVVDTDEVDVIRTFTSIRALIEQAPLPLRVKHRALAIFRALAEAEGRMHDMDPEQVHFHEVGALDAIVDIVGSCVALELLGIDRVFASPVATGTGTVHAAHGILPNPAPAVIELLKGAPVYGTNQTLELTTPTGAAILAALADDFGPMPVYDAILASGFGAGTRDLHGLPNVAQAVIGEIADPTLLVDAAGGQPVVQLAVNVDDATGEAIAHAVARLLEEGAHDAWITPILMKKGRPAYTVSVLVDVADVERVGQVLVEETGSLGVRGQLLQRWPAKRSFTEQNGIQIKTTPHRSKAEFDQAASVARSQGRPVREVLGETEHDHDHSHPH